jgi:hypothetical protein
MDHNRTPLPPPSGGAFAGAKRSIAMALLAIGLLVVGGSAVAFAADPSPSESPAASTTPTTGDDGATTAPETAPGTDSPGDARPGRGAHADCPDDGSSGGSSGGDTSSDSGTTPDATTVPAPSLDPSDV